MYDIYGKRESASAQISQFYNIKCRKRLIKLPYFGMIAPVYQAIHKFRIHDSLRDLILLIYMKS